MPLARSAIAIGRPLGPQYGPVSASLEADAAQQLAGVVIGGGDPADITTFSITSTAGGSNLPFAIGHTFRQGDVPSSTPIGGDSSLQVTIKNTWPDGSAKFALIAGRKTLTEGVASTVTLRTNGTVTGGSALTTTDLKTAMAGQTCSIACGAFGTVSWATTDFDSPFQTWVSGPEMSSWVYRKQVGSDTHLVGWIEVRLFVGGQVEVLPWIENGYLNVASPTNKSATYTFTLGSTQRFSAAIDLPNHCRTPLVSGALLSHWLSTDPGVSCQHNAAYMMSTDIVPKYFASISSGSSLVTSLPSTYTPLQQGRYPSTMGATGYDPSIGLLPQWDVLYLTSTASSVWSALQRQSYSAGRYGIHYRDETTNRPLRFASYPTTVMGGGSNVQGIGSSSTGTSTPTATGTSPASWTITHHPSLGFFAYLVTGRVYHLEEAQFAATSNYLNASSSPRENASSIFQTWAGITSRGAAWALRTLAQAACITPDADSIRGDMVTAVEANINRQHATYVSSTGANNMFGFLQNDSDMDGAVPGHYMVRTWMHDFYTAAFGLLKAVDISTDANVKARATQFFNWTARRVIGRMQGAGANEFLYRDAAVYDTFQNPSDTPSYPTTGPWYNNWGEVYTQTQAWNFPERVKELGDGSLRGTIDLSAYWGNLLPALCYAVRFNAPGAIAAYNRVTGAPNWSTLAATSSGAPEWATEPMVNPGALPSWVSSQPLWTWFDVPNSALSTYFAANPSELPSVGDRTFVTSGYNGSSLKRDGSVFYLAGNGGHNNYAGNEVYALTLNSETPTWDRLNAPTANADLRDNSEFYADLRPCSTHTYYAVHYIDALRRIVRMPTSGMSIGLPGGSIGAGTDVYVAEFLLSSNDWRLFGSANYPATYPGNGDWTSCLSAKHPLTEDIIYCRGSSSNWYRYSSMTGAWTAMSTSTLSSYKGAAIDPFRNRMLVCGNFSPASSPTGPWVRNTNGDAVSVTFGGLGESALGSVLGGATPNVQYDEVNDQYLVLYATGSTTEVLTVNADTWLVAAPTISGTKPGQNREGTRGLPKYVPELRGVVMVNGTPGSFSATSTNLKFIRTSA